MTKNRARLTITWSGDDLIYRLRGGDKGTGKIYKEVRSWDNPRATEEAERIIWNYAKANDLRIISDFEDEI